MRPQRFRLPIEPWMTYDQVALVLLVSRKRLYNLVAQHKLERRILVLGAARGQRLKSRGCGPPGRPRDDHDFGESDTLRRRAQSNCRVSWRRARDSNPQGPRPREQRVLVQPRAPGKLYLISPISKSRASGSAPHRQGSPTLPNPRDTTSNDDRRAYTPSSRQNLLCRIIGGPFGRRICPP